MANNLNYIVDMSITIANAVVSRAGFSTALILSAEANGKFSGNSKLYSSVDELLDDGFSATGVTYTTASKLKAQNPSPSVFKVGKRILSGGYQQNITLTVAPGNSGDIYSVDVDSVGYEYIRPDGYSDSQVATQLRTLLSGDTNFTVGGVGTAITMLSNDTGTVHKFDNIVRLAVTDNTSINDGYTLTDLANIVNYDADFYAVLLDCNQKDQVETVATWTEGVRRVLFFEANDTDTLDQAVTTDIFSVLKASSAANSLGLYYASIGTGAVAGWLGKGITYEPGSFNWAHKTIASVPVSTLSDSSLAVLRSKRGNYYVSIAGSGDTWSGITGSGEFIDTISLVHFLYARITEDVVACLKANVRIPYTNAGISTLTSVILARLRSKIGTGIAGSPAPYVTAPRVADIPSTDKQARHLPNVKFAGVLEGAINSLTINGTLTVDETIFASV